MVRVRGACIAAKGAQQDSSSIELHRSTGAVLATGGAREGVWGGGRAQERTSNAQVIQQ